MSETPYFTAKQLAERWHMNEQTLANWRHARKGPPFIRVSTRILYPVEGIHSFEKLSSQWLSQDS
jgi:hypothetical protein